MDTSGPTAGERSPTASVRNAWLRRSVVGRKHATHALVSLYSNELRRFREAPGHPV